MTRKIVGKYRPSIVSHLQAGGNKIQTLDGIADTLASSFAFNSSSENCTPAFKKHKLLLKRKRYPSAVTTLNIIMKNLV